MQSIYLWNACPVRLVFLEPGLQLTAWGDLLTIACERNLKFEQNQELERFSDDYFFNQEQALQIALLWVLNMFP